MRTAGFELWPAAASVGMADPQLDARLRIMEGSDSTSEYNPRRTQVACFVLPVRDERVLLARHKYAHQSLWGMVGGMAEEGEALDATARREAREETGLDVSTDHLAAVADRGALTLFVFSGRVLAGVESAQAAEIAELRWFAADELTDPDVFDLPRQVGRSVLSRPQGLVEAPVHWLDHSIAQCWVPGGQQVAARTAPPNGSRPRT